MKMTHVFILFGKENNCLQVSKAHLDQVTVGYRMVALTQRGISATLSCQWPSPQPCKVMHAMGPVLQMRTCKR